MDQTTPSENEERDNHDDHTEDGHEKTLDTIIVQATRSGRLLQDEPMRVEVIDQEEIEEKR